MIDYNNILTGDEADFLFGEVEKIEDSGEDTLFAPLDDDKKEQKDTDGLDLDNKEDLESVGDAKEVNQSGENADVSVQNPSPRFYASIAKALADEGVFSDFDISEDEISNVKTADDFIELHKKWSQAIRDEDDRRILEATQAGVEPDKIRQYEQTIRTLDQQFTEEALKQEGAQGDNLRRQIIYQDYINRGFGQERAQKAMERSFTAGTDLEDALDSIASVKEYFTSAYQEEIKSSKAVVESRANQIKKESEQLKKELLDSAEPITGFKVDKAVRQKAFDALVKPIGKDETGKPLTAIQKFEKENPVQFRKALGVLYALTDGFKDVSKVVKQQAKAEARKGMSELERALMGSGSASTLGGSLQLAGSGGFDDFNMKEGLILA